VHDVNQEWVCFNRIYASQWIFFIFLATKRWFLLDTNAAILIVLLKTMAKISPWLLLCLFKINKDNEEIWWYYFYKSCCYLWTQNKYFIARLPCRPILHVADVGKKFIAVELLVTCMLSIRTTMKNCLAMKTWEVFVKFNNFFGLFAVMKSWDLVSRPFLLVSVSILKVSGLVLVSKVTSLGHKPIETVNNARIWLCKTSVNQQLFSLLYLQVRNNQNTLKNASNLIKIQLLKFMAKCTNFEI